MLCVAALLPVVVVFAACGDDGSSELRSRDASSLRSTLTEVEQRVESQDCTGASQQAAAFREQIAGLPSRVGSDLRQALVSSAERLESLVAAQCAAEPAAPTEGPAVGTTSEDPAQQNDETQTDEGKKEKKPKQEKPNQDDSPNQDETQTQTQPDTGGASPEE
jgi:hypothetical protein